jgi:hypothetical protein
MLTPPDHDFDPHAVLLVLHAAFLHPVPHVLAAAQVLLPPAAVHNFLLSSTQGHIFCPWDHVVVRGTLAVRVTRLRKPHCSSFAADAAVEQVLVAEHVPGQGFFRGKKDGLRFAVRGDNAAVNE